LEYFAQALTQGRINVRFASFAVLKGQTMHPLLLFTVVLAFAGSWCAQSGMIVIVALSAAAIIRSKMP